MDLYCLLMKVPNSVCAEALSRKRILISQLHNGNSRSPQSYVKTYLQAYLQWDGDVVVIRDDDLQGTP